MKYTDTKEYVPNRFSCRIKPARDLIIAHTHTICNIKKHKKIRVYLAYHRIGIYLAHVFAAVFLLHVFYVQIPRGVVGMGHGHSGIVRDDVVVYGLYGFCIGFHPTDLRQNDLITNTFTALPAYAFGSECPKACT